MSLTSEHFSHLFLGVWSPSAWSMRLCLHALRMSTTFTELIFQVFISGLVCRCEVDWGSLSMLRFKYQPAWKGKLLVWSRSVRAVYIVQPLENSGHCGRGSKVRAWNRASQAGKEGEKGKEASVTLYNWRSSLSCCITAILLGLKNYHQMYHSEDKFSFQSCEYNEYQDGKSTAVNERRGAYTTTIAFWGKPAHWITHTLHDGNVWPNLI